MKNSRRLGSRLGLWVLALALAGAAPVKGQVQKSPAEGRAVLRSLILPGWGQHYLGHTRAARWLMGTEAGLWLGFALARETGQWLQQDYLAFGAEHAGLVLGATLKPNIYYYHVGNYDSITQYNQTQLRQRYLDDVYLEGAGRDWHWDAQANRERYESWRQSSVRLAKGATYALGGMVLNRVVAAVSVLFISRRPAQAAVLPLLLSSGGGMKLVLTF